ncbi:glycoside hydrolase family 25 protein [Actinopolymorpha alba]|uniref:glycoside hydrolase family 25 protein n=1 Tax=Actinopolymorpha alba TaxID=533267 RepID=UPI001ED9921A|nr:glycoside hydrolase family 25 protein [Actinopolymorpha alba]
MRGIDVSRYQTVTSWRSVKNAGYGFALIKATERDNYLSPTFRGYSRDARSAGLLAGSYHFARPARSTAAAQARWYVRQLRAAGFRSGTDLPPVLDIEDAGGRSRSALTQWCLAFCREVDQLLGLASQWSRCGIYCNRDFYRNRLDGPRVHDGRWWWLAYWPERQEQPRDEDELPAGAAIWQWTDRGRVPGVRENTDLNVTRAADVRSLAPAFFGEDDMPTFRHYGLGQDFPIPPVNAEGVPSPRALNFHVEWADPAPTAHGVGGSSYVRKSSDGWTSHELSGVRIEGMKPGDQYQLQLVIVDPGGEEILWSAVLHEARATAGDEHASVVRTLRSRVGQRVRWRFIYFGHQTSVKVARAEWVIKEY